MGVRFELVEGIIIDNETGLMWLQKPFVGVDQSCIDGLYTYEEAIKLSYDFGGYCDWRLPTIKELSGIIDYGRFAPACGIEFEFVEDNMVFWSSTLYLGISSYAWFVCFDHGYVDNGIWDYRLSVRLVRG